MNFNIYNKKIIVAFVSLLGYPLYNKKIKSQFFGGGAAVQIYLLARELAKMQNFEVHVLTSNYNYTNNQIEKIHNIIIHNIKPQKRKITYYFGNILGLFIELIKIDPNVIIQRGMNKLVGLFALYAKFFRKRFFFSIASVADISGKREIGFFGKVFKWGLLNADKIIAQTNDQVELLKYKKKMNLKNVIIIKNISNAKLKNFSRKKIFLWVGRAIPLKRPEKFLKLALEFSNHKFIMICNKTDRKINSIEYWKKINNLAKKINNINFIEYVPFHKINYYFEKTKFYINTSIFEGFPNPFLRAFQHGTPVISLKVNPDDILTKNKIGYACNDKFSKMVQKIKRLIEDNDEYKNYSENCLKYVRREHNKNRIIKDWIKILRVKKES